MGDKPFVVTSNPSISQGPFRQDSSNTDSHSFFGDVIDGAVRGSYSNNESAGSTLGQIAVGVIPWVGQVADARDTKAAYEKLQNGEQGSGFEFGLTLLGWLPLVGDWAKNSLRPIKRPLGEFVDGATSYVSRKFDEISEAFSGLFSKPSITPDPFMEVGTGETDKLGNVVYSMLGSADEQALVLNHELVHSFLSPKFKLLQDFRADIAMTAYQKSSFMRYLEEALAETYAQLKVNGLEGIPSGLRFPLENGYVELRDVLSEAAIGSVVIGGVGYGAYVVADGVSAE